MNREVTEKVIVSLLLVCCYLFLPAVGYRSGDATLHNHLLFSFSHANIWHLIGNIACVWAIRGRFRWLFGYLVSIIISFIPSLTELPVCGFSCMIFAEIGRRFGATAFNGLLRRLFVMAKCVWPAFVIGIFLPKIAVFPHLWALLGGFGAAIILRQREQLKWEALFLFLWMRKKIYGRI